jgi:ribonucleoside-diphosphate reductase beta chain
MSDIFKARDVYKPLVYPWADELWRKHEQMHWLAREVPLHEDVRDWNNKLTQEDRNFLTDVFILFTQSDVDVAGGYIDDYFPHFKQPELRMMLLGFAAREAVHIDAYSFLVETVGMEDSFYKKFLDIGVMKAKHDFFNTFVSSSKSGKKKKKEQVLAQIAGISAFTEGMFLFSSFVMLLAYPRKNMMKGMGQIVSWSVLDEQMHVKGLTKIFNTIVEENSSFLTRDVIDDIRATGEMMAELEFDFIDYVYRKKQDMHGLDKDQLKEYIKYTVDLRLKDLNVPTLFGVNLNPLPWVDEMISSQNHENFFEARATSYAKGATTGSWGDVWGHYKDPGKEAA